MKWFSGTGLAALLALGMTTGAVAAEQQYGPGVTHNKPVVLLIARGEATAGGEPSLKIAIDKEANAIIGKLNGLGYTVEVASEDGKNIQAGGSTLKVDKKLADVQVTDYVGVIIPCMSSGNILSGLKIVQDMHSRNLPVAAQNGGVLILATAGVLKGRNYSIGEGFERYVKDGVFTGVGVVRVGNILTSGICPNAAQRTGLKDGTDELVMAFAGMLKT